MNIEDLSQYGFCTKNENGCEEINFTVIPNPFQLIFNRLPKKTILEYAHGKWVYKSSGVTYPNQDFAEKVRRAVTRLNTKDKGFF